MAFKILSPEEAKKRAKANVAEWLRKKGMDAKRKTTEPKTETISGPKPNEEPEIEKQEKSPAHPRTITPGRPQNTKIGDDMARYLNGAISMDNMWATKELIDQIGDVNARLSRNSTALIRASYYGSESIAKMLLDKGAAVDSEDDNKMTALMWAAARGNSGVVELLLSSGANINAKDGEGFTALMRAAGQLEVVKVLIKAGAEINVRNNENKTALGKALDLGKFFDDHPYDNCQEEIVRFLRKHGAVE